MNLTYVYIIVALLAVFIVFYNNIVDTKSIIRSINPLLHKLMEKDYEFLVRTKYGYRKTFSNKN